MVMRLKTSFYEDLIKFIKNDEIDSEAIEHKWFQFYKHYLLKYKSKHTIGFKRWRSIQWSV